MGEQKHPTDEKTVPRPGDDARLGTPGAGENVCPTCAGSGRLDGRPCPECEGTGVVVEGIGGG